MYLTEGYKTYKMADLLDPMQYDNFLNCSKDWLQHGVELGKVKSPLYFLNWSPRIQELFQAQHPEEYSRIIEENSFGYEDYLKMVEINKIHGVNLPEGAINPPDGDMVPGDYFNFYLVTRPLQEEGGEEFPHLAGFFQEASANILLDLYGKKGLPEMGFIDHMNVYPKGSFIAKHHDGAVADENNPRLFVMLFFLCEDRTKEDGSVLRIFTPEGTVEIVPDLNTVVVLEQNKIDLIHDVTENLSDKMRYTIYCNFTKTSYETLMAAE